jgi:hypothetical protein
MTFPEASPVQSGDEANGTSPAAYRLIRKADQMDGYIWRVPTLLGVMACFTLALFAAGVCASIMRRRRDSVSATLITVCLLTLIAIAGGIALRMTAASIARSLGVRFELFQPGPAAYIAPLVLAAFAFAVGRRMLHGTWTNLRAALFYLWLFVFTAANVVNWCSPGFCETIGFPFPWQYWSDVIFLDPPNEGFWDVAALLGQLLAAGLNLATFVFVSRVLTRVRIRGSSA